MNARRFALAARNLAGDALLCIGWHAMRCVAPIALGAAGTVLGLVLFGADEIRRAR